MSATLSFLRCGCRSQSAAELASMLQRTRMHGKPNRAVPEARLTVQDMGNGVTVEDLMRTVEDLSRSCH